MDCVVVLKGGPWFVIGQLLAMEAWKLDVMPGRRMIERVIVWMRLPGLSREFWLSTSILAIAIEAGRSLAMDNFTDLLWKAGYARGRVEIDVGLPLKSGVLIRGKKGSFGSILFIKTSLRSIIGVEGWVIPMMAAASPKENPLLTPVIAPYNLKILWLRRMMVVWDL